MHPNAYNTSKDQKLQKRTFYGYKRQNQYDYVKSRALPIIKYKISPVGIGKICSIRSKLQNIIGSLFEGQNSNQIDPCFQFILKKLIYYESINSQKKTDYKNIVFGEMSVDLTNKHQEDAIRNKVYKVISEWQQQKNQQKKQNSSPFKQLTRIQKLKAYLQKVEIFKQKLRQSLREKYKQKLANATNLTEAEKYLLSNKYIEEIIRNVDAIQILRISQQTIKYNSFEKKNKQYFQVSLIRQRAITKPYIYIKINRPSNQMEPLFQNIYDLVRQREKDINYMPQGNILYRDIFEQIRKYQSNLEGIRCQYQYLNPANIIFDQIALAPKLSFQPLLLNTLGLSKKPMTIEARILFAPTPKEFDYFMSRPQFQAQTQIKLKDPFYGNIDIYDSDRHRMNNQQVQKVLKQEAEVEQLKQKIITWRFMLVCYYLLYSQQYGFVPNLTSYKEKQEKMKAKIDQAHHNVESNASNLSTFFGIENQYIQSKPFNFTLAEIGEFLSIQNQDSVVQNNKYVIVKKYFQCRNLILKQFIRLLVTDKIFGRILNIKKYIFLYLAIAVQILQQSKRYIKAERVQPKQRKRLRVYLQTQLKRMKNDKDHYGYLQITREKIEIYRKREANKDPQAKFAKQQDVGKIMMKYVDQAKNSIHQIQQLNKILDDLEGHNEALNLEEKKTYIQTMGKIDNIVDKYSQELKAVLNQFIFSELRLRHRDGPHRFPSDPRQYVKQSYNIYTNRLQLLTLTFISISQSNFIKYDSLVIPHFKIQDTQKNIEIQKKKDILQSEENLLKIISEVIQPAKLLPKKMEKLSSKTINEEFLNYHSKRQSVDCPIKSEDKMNLLIFTKQGRIKNSL